MLEANAVKKKKKKRKQTEGSVSSEFSISVLPWWKFYRNDEGNRVDHLQKKRHLEDLLPDVPLKPKKTRHKNTF